VMFVEKCMGRTAFVVYHCATQLVFCTVMVTFKCVVLNPASSCGVGNIKFCLILLALLSYQRFVRTFQAFGLIGNVNRTESRV
jgi:hypothetical protein